MAAKKKEEKKKKPPTMAEILKKYSGGAKPRNLDVRSISLNKLLGGDGMPTGKYIQIYAKQGVGKTTVCVWIAIALARIGLKTLFLDVEQALEPSLIYGCGGREFYKEDGTGLIVVVRPVTYVHLEEIMDRMILEKEFTLGVIDSLAMVIPSSTLTRSVEEPKVMAKAGPQTLFLEKYKAQCRYAGITLIFVNHIKVKGKNIGNKTIFSDAATGSNALAYSSDITVDLRKGQFIIEDGVKIGQSVTAIAEKNKKIMPFAEFPLHIIFGKGISNVRTLASIMEAENLVELNGSWYTAMIGPKPYGKYQGKENLVKWVRENVDMVEKELRKRDLL